MAQENSRPNTLLVLHSYNSEYRWTADIQRGIERAFEAFPASRLMYTEYLDWKRVPDPQTVARNADLWRVKYRNIHIDVIVVSDDKALEFAVKNRAEIFSNAPIVFTGVFPESVLPLTGGAKGVTGVYEEQDIADTVKIAHAVVRNPEHIYLVNDLSESGQAVERHLNDAITALIPDVPVWSLSESSIEEIELFLSKRTGDDAIFIGSYSIDARGRTYTGETLIGRVAAAANCPVFVLNTHHLGTGALGGMLLSPTLLGKNAGLIAGRILAGENPDAIKPLSASSYTAMFDWNAVKRFNVRRSALPANAVFINREIPFHEKYRRELSIIGATFLVLLAALFVSVHNFRRSKRLAEVLAEKNEELTRTKESLELSDERYRLAAIGSNDALWDWDFATGNVHFADRWFEMIGQNASERKDSTIVSYLIRGDADRFNEAFAEHLAGRTEFLRIEARVKAADANLKWVSIQGKAVKDPDGKPIRVVGSITDIDYRKQNEKKIETLAYYDQLTSLPNRSLAIETAQTAVLATEKGSSCGLMFIDIDNFKRINDRFGHSVGDKVLVQAAHALSTIVNEGIHLSRFGGDEFVLLVENTAPKQMEKYGQLAIRLLNRPLQIDGRSHFLSASAGLALYPDHASSAEELFQKADAALHRAKMSGKTSFFMFNESIQRELVDRVSLENGLRTAIANGEMWVAYQPQVDARTGKIEGFEALIRWENPREGVISPDKFIPIAEESGQIDKIGLFVLTRVAHFIKRAKRQDFTVSINVSVKELRDPDFVTNIVKTLNHHEIGPNRIALEITESFLIEELDPVIERLSQLRAAGFKLSLDDFGKGYSSLSYLRSLPLDYIKIDKSFIDDILERGGSLPLAKSIISLSHQLGLKVVAEGVEERKQLDYLRENDCDYIQGYYYGRPEREETVLTQLELSFS